MCVLRDTFNSTAFCCAGIGDGQISAGIHADRGVARVIGVCIVVFDGVAVEVDGDGLALYHDLLAVELLRVLCLDDGFIGG